MSLNQTDLGQFYGSETRTRWSPLFRNFVLSEGALYVAKHGGTNGACWLMDAIASHWIKLRKNKDHRLQEMQFWNLKVTGNSAVLTCRADSGVKPAVTQKIEYTDFDLPEIDLWAEYDGTYWTILLPSEH